MSGWLPEQVPVVVIENANGPLELITVPCVEQPPLAYIGRVDDVHVATPAYVNPVDAVAAGHTVVVIGVGAPDELNISNSPELDVGA